MLKLYLSILFFLFQASLFNGLVYAETESKTVDGVVGVVGNDVITQSELDEAMLTLGGALATQNSRTSLQDVLNQLIERKLLLIQAEKESLEVKSDELQDAVENAMLEIRGRFPSDFAYLLELEKAGITEASLKEKYTKQIRETLLIQKLFQKKFGKKLVVTDIEAREFFNTHKDSIPPEPAGVRLLGAIVPYRMSEEALAKTKSKAQKILKLAEEGKSFGELVRTYSDDERTKAQGGALGTVEINDLSPEIRGAVAGLKEGEVALVEIAQAPLRLGGVWHIIKCDARYKDKATLREILIKAVPTSKDSIATKEVVEKAKESLQNSSPFLEGRGSTSGAEIISKGEDFIPLHLTPFSSLNEIVIDKIYTFYAPDGCQVIKPIEVREEQFPEWENVRKELKNFLYERRLNGLSKGLIEKLKQDIYTKSML